MKTTKTLKKALAFLLFSATLSATMVSCKSDVNMTRRKKSNCNTCPTFSYNQPVDDNAFQIAGI